MLKNQNYKIPCFILARKNSKGLKNKNIFPLDKKPLILHTIEYAKKCKFVSDIVISTDDKRIKRISEKNGCKVLFPRPKKLSNDNASNVVALKHLINFYETNISKLDYFAFMQITEPLRPKNILKNCFEAIKQKNLNSAFAGFVYKKNFWIEIKGQKYKPISPINERNKPRQKRKMIFREDCGLALITRRDTLIKENKLFKKPFEIIPYTGISGYIDIHEKKDIKIASILMKIKL